MGETLLVEIEFDDEPPAELRLRAALWDAERHILRREFAAAAGALEGVLAVAGDQTELVRGLLHLAAAGYRAQAGEPLRARRQLEHARRRLGPFLPARGDVDLAGLLAAVSGPLDV
jgi:hypothetical protein